MACDPTPAANQTCDTAIAFDGPANPGALTSVGQPTADADDRDRTEPWDKSTDPIWLARADDFAWTTHNPALQGAAVTRVLWIDELSLWVVAQFLVGNAGPTILTSPDAVAWTDASPWTNATIGGVWDVAWNGTVLVAVGKDSTGAVAIASSPDASTWTTHGNPFGTTSPNGGLAVAWSQPLGLFAAIGNAQGGTVDGIVTSPDGATWTHRASVFDAFGSSPSAMYWSDDLAVFVASGFTSTITTSVATSTDGLTWTPHSDPTMDAVTASQFVYFGGKLFALTPGNGYQESTDGGVSWTAVAAPPPGSASGHPFAIVGPLLYALTGSGLFVSDDGEAWTASTPFPLTGTTFSALASDGGTPPTILAATGSGSSWIATGSDGDGGAGLPLWWTFTNPFATSAILRVGVEAPADQPSCAPLVGGYVGLFESVGSAGCPDSLVPAPESPYSTPGGPEPTWTPVVNLASADFATAVVAPGETCYVEVDAPPADDPGGRFRLRWWLEAANYRDLAMLAPAAGASWPILTTEVYGGVSGSSYCEARGYGWLAAANVLRRLDLATGHVVDITIPVDNAFTGTAGVRSVVDTDGTNVWVAVVQSLTDAPCPTGGIWDVNRIIVFCLTDPDGNLDFPIGTVEAETLNTIGPVIDGSVTFYGITGAAATTADQSRPAELYLAWSEIGPTVSTGDPVDADYLARIVAAKFSTTGKIAETDWFASTTTNAEWRANTTLGSDGGANDWFVAPLTDIISGPGYVLCSDQPEIELYLLLAQGAADTTPGLPRRQVDVRTVGSDLTLSAVRQTVVYVAASGFAGSFPDDGHHWISEFTVERVAHSRFLYPSETYGTHTVRSIAVNFFSDAAPEPTPVELLAVPVYDLDAIIGCQPEDTTFPFAWTGSLGATAAKRINWDRYDQPWFWAAALSTSGAALVAPGLVMFDRSGSSNLWYGDQDDSSAANGTQASFLDQSYDAWRAAGTDGVARLNLARLYVLVGIGPYSPTSPARFAAGHLRLEPIRATLG